MAHYPPYKKPSLTRKYRYMVTYENCENANTKTFAVWAHSQSEASARTIDYITEKRINRSQDSYTLLVQKSMVDCDYNIN